MRRGTWLWYFLVASRPACSNNGICDSLANKVHRLAVQVFRSMYVSNMTAIQCFCQVDAVEGGISGRLGKHCNICIPGHWVQIGSRVNMARYSGRIYSAVACPMAEVEQWYCVRMSKGRYLDGEVPTTRVELSCWQSFDVLRRGGAASNMCA